MKEHSYAPMYVALYPQLAEVVRAHGYALAVHGSLGRDMDLICVPWVEQPSAPSEVVSAITGKFAIVSVGKPNTSHHGRQRWTISVGFGDCCIDLSFMPPVAIGRCGTCRHFSNDQKNWRGEPIGHCAGGKGYGWPVDGSGFCHLHDAQEAK